LSLARGLTTNFADKLVPYTTSEDFSKALSDKGIYNVLYPIDGADHTPIQYMKDIEDNVVKFLFKILLEQ
jgi:fermentation-respiration switch protein FrsA (DUF1100 family)